MAKYLKSKEEVLSDIRDIARSLTVDDLISIMNINGFKEKENPKKWKRLNALLRNRY